MTLAEISILPVDSLFHFPLHDTWHLIKDQSLEMGTILAQKIEDPQILDKLQKSYKNFIESGQVWALIIGFILGYIFRTFTGF